MKNGNAIHRRQMIEVLSRVVAAGKVSKFQLREVCPNDAATHANAFENLIEAGLIERVREGCGVWFCRLTAAGVVAGREKKLPRPPKVQTLRADDFERPAGLGLPSGRRRRWAPGTAGATNWDDD